MPVSSIDTQGAMCKSTQESTILPQFMTHQSFIASRYAQRLHAPLCIASPSPPYRRSPLHRCDLMCSLVQYRNTEGPPQRLYSTAHSIENSAQPVVALSLSFSPFSFLLHTPLQRWKKEKAKGLRWTRHPSSVFAKR